MEWKDINGFEGKYQISEDGRVRSIGRVVKNKCGTMTVNERILKPWIDTWGYKNVSDLRDMKAADVAPVRHARWDENGRCSNCGGHAPFWCMASTYYKSPWCQECGAKMDLEG